MQDYRQFLANKKQRITITGFDVDPDYINPKMYPFQRDIVRWSLRLGKAAIFAAVGLGKTFMQLEWARLVVEYTGQPVLILAPLAVTIQTSREAVKWGITDTAPPYITSHNDVTGPGIYITNYHRLENIDTSIFAGVVLDESSILKSFNGKTKMMMVSRFEHTPYKLACTATPAPNDFMEFGSHAEFLNIMRRDEMLARWFIHDSANTSEWRLKGHAQDDFWAWLTSWAVAITRPADLGDDYHMSGYDLPPLNIVGHTAHANQDSIERAWSEGRLMPDTNPSSTELGRVKRESIADRIVIAKEIVSSLPANEPVLIWCHLNDEADALRDAFPDAVEVRGNDSPDVKTAKLTGFSDGEYRILITKPKIAGFGMNWQHCANPIFFGLDFSFESFYQAIGRNYRYGQERTVNAHIIYAETEGNVISTLYHKQDQFRKMQNRMAAAMLKHGLFRDEKRKEVSNVDSKVTDGNNWTMHLGDCVEVAYNMPDDSVDLSVFSPPFSNLFVYSDQEQDMGNNSDDDFNTHFSYLIGELYRITTPGRLAAVHVSDLPMLKSIDGHMGLKDFSGDVIKLFTAHGWIYHSRITIYKNPVVEMTRTKAHGLLHKTFTKDASKVRVGMPDYMLIFRKPGGDKPVKQKRTAGDYIGTNPPVDPMDKKDHRRYSIEVWQRYADPVWFDIDQTNVLNYRQAKDNRDEKHICPLQLDVIARCVDLWSNEGDVVFSPFAGIGSEGYEAIKLGRKFIGVELKESYYKQACKFLAEAERARGQRTLFDLVDATGT